MRQQFGGFVSTSNEAVADELDFDFEAGVGEAFAVSFYMPTNNN